MKKLYLLLLLSLLRLPALHAQQTDSLSLKLNAVFANVDKSQVPTRLLDAYEALEKTVGPDVVAYPTASGPTVFL